ncbi:MAG TPA: flagellar hook-associated protein FlgK [Nitrospirota bacterium]
MASIFGIMDVAKTGLFASQVAIQTIGQNIANASTPGYSRQVVRMEAQTPIDSSPGMIGRGVKAASIERQYNTFVEDELVKEEQTFGQMSASADSLTRVENFFNESTSKGIGTALDDLFNAFHDLANKPAGPAERTNLLAKADTLTMTVRQTYGDLESTRQSADADVSRCISEINTKATAIAQLNVEISRAEASHQNANDLRDQRGQLLRDLAGQVDITTYENEIGQVDVLIGGSKPIVQGAETIQLTAERNMAGDGMVQVGYKNTSGQPEIITDKIRSGRLKGFLDVRDNAVPKLEAQLDQLATGLTKDMNLLHSAGTGLDGSTGLNFFKPTVPAGWTGENTGNGMISSGTVTDLSALSLDKFEITFTAANTFDIKDTDTGAVVSAGNAFTSGGNIDFGGMRYTITGTPNAGDKFYASASKGAAKVFAVADEVKADNKKIAAASDPALLPGDNRNAAAMAAIGDQMTMSDGTATFKTFYESIIDGAGVESQRATSQRNFHESLLKGLETRRDEVSGVSLDEEVTSMTQYQRSYQASARIISVVDEMLQTLLSLK